MINTPTLKKAWSLLDRRERRNAGLVLVVVIVSALGAALMVGSVFPFLSVLADPSNISRNDQLLWVYETFGFTSDFAFLVALGVATLAIIVLTNLLQLVRVYVISRYAKMRSHSLSRRLLGLYLRQPYEFFLERHSGDMSTRVLSEAEQVVNTFFRPFTEVVAGILTAVAVVSLLILINPAVAIGAFTIFGGLYALFFLGVRAKLTQLGQGRAKANKKRFLTAKEVLGGIKEVKLRGHEEAYLNRFSTSSYKTMHNSLVSNLIGKLPHYFVQIFASGGVVVLCLLLLDRDAFETGDPALGELLPLIGVIAFAARRLMPELTRIYTNFAQMRFGVAAVDSVYDDFQAAASVSKVRKKTGQALGLASELRLENLSYRYPNAAKDSLTSVSLSIRAGERIGIVGGTGAGKTTIADIVLGLLSPTSGHVAADGVVIGEHNRRQWQDSVGYVPQDIFLIDATIAENIAFGIAGPKIDRQRMEEVSRIAQLDDFVRAELPDGYETTVGERGVRLSGGQRQRIGIARALYHGADLIVFDEATSALDNLTERGVMAAIEAVPGSKTILMIAHRLSTVKKCDRIIVLDHGEIVGIGPWDDLLVHNSAFRELADAA